MKLFNHRRSERIGNDLQIVAASDLHASSVFNLHLRTTDDSSHIIEFAICIFRLCYAFANDRVDRVSRSLYILTFGNNFLDGVLLQSNGSQGTLKG